ncbi:hypothetical protein [Xanthomonas campestris]|uniref:hypothetical protein n=1 Tax=Xanthomonas campestris TaxID=339 RepID=UPI001E317E3E|nr:hypothetical protein [Xanthomonas campestris]MCC5070743.1 hypothetical protein [Xanthomonas campestris pv. plantaginis]MEA9607933.1 hypothetical protein [Xanthomonas campestris pv. plantaginis]
MRREIGWLADRQPMLVTEDGKNGVDFQAPAFRKRRRLPSHPDQASIEHAAKSCTHQVLQSINLCWTQPQAYRGKPPGNASPQPNNTDEICDRVIGNIRSAREARIYDVHHFERKNKAEATTCRFDFATPGHRYESINCLLPNNAHRAA